MRPFFTLIIVLLSVSVLSAQYHLKAIDIAKEIKLLSDDRETARKAFRDFNHDFSDENSDSFSLGETEIEVYYSSGTCSDERLEEEVWDVPKDRVIRIEISDDPGQMRFDLEKLVQEQVFAENEAVQIFHNKREGFAIRTSEGEPRRVILMPPLSVKVKPCSTGYAKAYIEGKSWFGNQNLEDRFVCILVNSHASVTGLDVSHDRLSAVTSKQVRVTTKAEDLEGDVLTYNYEVSGGVIRGSGANVIWDLTGVKPASYTITASVDDGAGPIGERRTRTIVVE